jgi:hypothetical protein
MGLKTNDSLIDARLSKMEATIKNITTHTAIGNLVVNQLMEHKAITTVTTKATSTQEPKRTTVMAKNLAGL